MKTIASVILASLIAIVLCVQSYADYDTAQAVKVTVNMPTPNKAVGIKLWSDEYDQTIWTHSNTDENITYIERRGERESTVTRDVTVSDTLGHLNIYVCTIEEKPWSITASSSGFTDSKKKHFDFKAWFSAPGDIAAGQGTYAQGDLPDGGFLLNGERTIYTAAPSEYRTYLRGKATVTPAMDENLEEPTEVSLEDVYIVGGFSVYRGKTVAQGEYSSSIVLTLVQ